MRRGSGSLEEGEVSGFSTTVPNCAKAVGVRSSMGILIDGAGIDVGMFVVVYQECLVHRIVVGSPGTGKWSTKIEARLGL